jgi:hypothetical protein
MTGSRWRGTNKESLVLQEWRELLACARAIAILQGCNEVNLTANLASK